MAYIFLYSILSSIYLIVCGNPLIKNKTNSISEICKKGIFGSIILSAVSLILNFFFPIDQNISTIVFFAFFIPPLIYSLKKQNLKKILIISIISGAITTLLLILDNIYRPDAGLYHLPYTKVINENKIIFGIADVHFRFGHVSILQYLNAIYNNHLFKDNGIILPIASIFSLLVIYFLSEIYNQFKTNKIYSLFVYFILVYIFYGYNRYSEFGNDALGHILFLFCASIFIKNFRYKEKQTIKELILLSVFIFLNKPTLIGVFAIPLYYLFFLTKIKNFFNKTNFYAFLFLISWLVKNVITSGCLIYPVAETCFSKLSWYSDDVKFNISAKIQSLDNEAWTKGWPDIKNTNVTQKEYVKGITWLKVWSHNHGLDILKKISVFLFFLAVIDIILLKFVKKKKYEKNKLFESENKRIIYLIFVSFIGTSIWFLKFPVFRYGSSYVVIFLISLNVFFFKDYIRNINSKKIITFFKILIFLIMIIFILKNILRIYKNFDYKYYNYPWPKIYSDPNNSKIITKPIYYNNLLFYHLAKQECHYNASPCTNYLVNNVSFYKKNGYKFYIINK